MRLAIGPWIPQYIRIEFSNKKVFLDRLYDTALGDAIRVMQRSSCYVCPFAGVHGMADITLGDYHGAVPGAGYYHESGTSIAVVHTEKGKELFSVLNKDNSYFELVDYEELAKHNPRMKAPWLPRPEMQLFTETLSKDGLFAASSAITQPKIRIKRRIPVKLRVRIESIRREAIKRKKRE